MRLATPQSRRFPNLGGYPLGQGVAQVAARNPAYYLTGKIFSVNCIFLYGDLATNRSVGSRARLRLSPAGSGVFLRSLPAWPFRGETPPRYRSACVGTRKMA